MSGPINRITEEDIAYFHGTQTLKAYQQAAGKSAIYPGKGTILGLLYCGLKLNGEAGELAEHIGKALRDDDAMPLSTGDDGRRGDTDCVWLEDCNLTKTRHDLIVKEIGDCLWYLGAMCNELGITLYDAASINLYKLKDRGDRDQLQGSGDER